MMVLIWRNGEIDAIPCNSEEEVQRVLGGAMPSDDWTHIQVCEVRTAYRKEPPLQPAV